MRHLRRSLGQSVPEAENTRPRSRLLGKNGSGKPAKRLPPESSAMRHMSEDSKRASHRSRLSTSPIPNCLGLRRLNRSPRLEGCRSTNSCNHLKDG